MRLILTGIEYAGKRTLGIEISRWWAKQTGQEFLEPPHFAFHDHFTLPHVVHAMGHEDHKTQTEKDLLNANPGLQQLLQLYNIGNKFGQGYYDMPDLFLIDWYYSDAVYASLYYGYGGPDSGSPIRSPEGQRTEMARHMEEEILERAPHTVLVLMKATPEVIRARATENTHPDPETVKRQYRSKPFGEPTRGVVRDEDVEHVLARFKEEFEASLIRNKLVLDTSSAIVEETLAEFVEKVTPMLSDADRERMAQHKK